MPTFVEKPESRSFSEDANGVPETGEILATVYGTSNEEVVEELCELNLPAFFRGLLIQGYEVTAQEGEVWDVKADYSRAQPRVPPPSGTPPSFESRLSISFDTSGDTIHLTQSPGSSGYDVEGRKVEIAENNKGAIRLTDRGVEGIDVNAGGFEWSETHRVPAALITEKYLQNLKKTSWHTNDAEFRGFDKREVLFKGASGSHRQGEDAEITFTFNAKENRSEANGNAATIGDIKNITINGHDYVDVRYKDAVDAVGGFQVKVPQQVIVHEIFTPRDFGVLDIG